MGNQESRQLDQTQAQKFRAKHQAQQAQQTQQTQQQANGHYQTSNVRANNNNNDIYSTPLRQQSQWLQIYSPTKTPATKQFRTQDFTVGNQVLGEGSFAKVVLGTHSSGKRVAVKVIDKLKTPENLRTYAVREPSILAHLKHPNIVKLLHHHEDRAQIQIFLQFMEGGDLHSYVERRRQLEETESRMLFAQIVDAVDYLHKHKICHRDLKLENILIGQTGKGNNLRKKILLIDFGFAGIMREEKKFTDYPGSVCYAAPELLSGTPYDGTGVDIYALGVTLYTMIHGCYPFADEDKNKMYKMVWEDEPVYDNEISGELISLLQSMLTKDPAQRATMDQIKQHPWMADAFDGPFASTATSPFVQKLRSEVSRLSPKKLKQNISPANVKRAMSPSHAKRKVDQMRNKHRNTTPTKLVF